MILAGAIGSTLDPRPAQLVASLNINTELAIGPLTFLFVCSILDPERRFRRRDLVHFLPLILGFVGWGIAWARFNDFPGPSLNPRLTPVVPFFVLFKACWLFTYLTAAYQTIERGLSASVRFDAGRQSVGLRWLKVWILLLGGMAGTIYTTYYAGKYRVTPEIMT